MPLHYEHETYAIIGACMTVHQALGNGFLESVYQEALERTLTKNKIPFQRQKKLKILFDGQELEKYFIADFICYNSIILEIKAADFIHKSHHLQIVNYLKSTNMPVGLLINFGETSLKWKRVIHTPSQSV